MHSNHPKQMWLCVKIHNKKLKHIMTNEQRALFNCHSLWHLGAMRCWRTLTSHWEFKCPTFNHGKPFFYAQRPFCIQFFPQDISAGDPLLHQSKRLQSEIPPLHTIFRNSHMGSIYCQGNQISRQALVVIQMHVHIWLVVSGNYNIFFYLEQTVW